MTIRTIINNCFSCELHDYNNEALHTGTQLGHSTVELDNGIIIKDCGDGRYYTDGNDNQRWANVEVCEFDDNGEFVQSIEILGYTEV